ncbi:MAG: DUF3307 domain-containing protein [Litorilinea sp.]
MDTFSWLIIGHLVGDWCLQNRWMAEGKLRGAASGPLLVHCCIYTVAVSGGALFALGGQAAWWEIAGFGGAVWVSHWLIDGLNLAYHWGRLTRQSDTAVVRMGVDQTLHVGVVGCAALWIG